MLWERDSQRIVEIVRTSFTLVIHPRVPQEAKGVVIPKPNKPDYGVSTPDRVITLLNCVGRVVEKVAANAIAEECERQGLLHKRQFGCRKRRPAIDVFGRWLKGVEEAWERGNTVAVLLVDVEGAFPHVAKGHLIQRMEEMGFDAKQVRLVGHVMEERKVIMSMDGMEGDSMDVEMGVLQGSPVCPVLFILYLSGLLGEAEEKEKQLGSEGISFVDDVAWVEEGEHVGGCTQGLGRCATETQIWVKENACQFEIGKTESVLFTG